MKTVNKIGKYIIFDNKSEEENPSDYISYGMCFGLLFGVALSNFIGIISVALGMLLGVFLGGLLFSIKNLIRTINNSKNQH